jgi:hypothetical protein
MANHVEPQIRIVTRYKKALLNALSSTRWLRIL